MERFYCYVMQTIKNHICLYVYLLLTLNVPGLVYHGIIPVTTPVNSVFAAAVVLPETQC